jgi:hypothetical protein
MDITYIDNCGMKFGNKISCGSKLPWSSFSFCLTQVLAGKAASRNIQVSLVSFHSKVFYTLFSVLLFSSCQYFR